MQEHIRYAAGYKPRADMEGQAIYMSQLDNIIPLN